MVGTSNTSKYKPISSQAFRASFGISLGTLRHSEEGLLTPRGPAQVLLKVVEQNPQAVIKTLGGQGP